MLSVPVGTNIVNLCGVSRGEAQFSHQTRNEKFYSFVLSVPRRSGIDDHLNIIVPEPALAGLDTSEGAQLHITGQLRSYNNKSGQGSKLIISVYAVSIENTEDPPENDVTLTGMICRVPVLRKTPLGREICDFTLAVGRRYGRVDYLPCIAWGSVARMCVGIESGAAVACQGRIQSRTYIKRFETQNVEKTAFEISCATVCLVEAKP